MLKNTIEKELLELENDNRKRSIKINDDNFLNFSSNDYLGLAKDKNIFNKFFSSLNFNEFKMSSSSSRLIDGSYKVVMDLEEEVEKIYKKPCLVFNSGFDANSSVIETFFSKDSLIITDRLNHASIYEGCINSNAKILRYNHLDIKALEKLLSKYSGQYEDILVVTETVYSMDGDIANIKDIVKLKDKYKFQLMVDEAHSYGVYSYGIAYQQKLVENIDFLVIPLGKGGASMGAYVICDSLFKEYLINKSRKFIYSTALPPISNIWNLYILKNIPEFEERINNLRELTIYSLETLKNMGIESISESHIISIVVGDNKKVTDLSNKLKENFYLVYPIKEPTVPRNTARLRISLTADMKKEDLKKFFEILKQEIDNLV